MKKILLLLLLVFCVYSFATPPSKKWNTDFNQAYAQAKKEKLPLLLLFTGSDWCGYCKKLKKEVLTNKAFEKATNGKVVLVYIDFPRKSKLSAKEVALNKKLANKFNVSGYPTTIIANIEGDEIGKIGGYAPLKKYIHEIEKYTSK